MPPGAVAQIENEFDQAGRSLSPFVLNIENRTKARDGRLAAPQSIQLHAFNVDLDHAAHVEFKLVDGHHAHLIAGVAADQAEPSEIVGTRRVEAGHGDVARPGAYRRPVWIDIGHLV